MRVRAFLILAACVYRVGCDGCGEAGAPTCREGAEAGTGDAGATGDGGPLVDGGTPAICARPGVLCEDFETGVLDGGLWSQDVTGGTVAVDGTAPHAGNFSLHVQVAPSDAGARVQLEIMERAAFPTPKLFLRAFYRFSAAPPATEQARIAYAASFTGTSYPGQNFYAALRGPMSIDNASSGLYITSASSFPSGDWACLEWEIDIPPDPSFQTVWIDGGEISDLASDASTALPDAGTRFVGLGFYDPRVARSLPAMDLWVDDIVVSDVRVGCGP